MDQGGSGGGLKIGHVDAESREFLESFDLEIEEIPTRERAGEDSRDPLKEALSPLSQSRPPKIVKCSNCGKDFEQTPGRSFRKCEDCRLPQQKVDLNKAKEPVGKHLDLRLRRIAAGVEENINLLGAGLLFVMPTTGTIICRDSEAISQNIVKLCQKHPKLVEALEAANQAAPGLMLGKSLATIGVAAMVDMNRINQEEVIKGNVQLANMLGVAKVFKELHTMQDGVVFEAPQAPKAAFV